MIHTPHICTAAKSTYQKYMICLPAPAMKKQTDRSLIHFLKSVCYRTLKIVPILYIYKLGNEKTR